MDINFHYYTVKALAVYAGFSEEYSQLIAEYSQFTDDCSLRGTLSVNWAPQEAIDCGISTQIGSSFKTKLLPTGFSMFDTVSLLAYPDLCRQILVSFHFIPAQGALPMDKHAAVMPAKPRDNDLINRLLEKKRQKYKADLTSGSDNILKADLVQIGVLLHVFSDTYAHQLFSGDHCRDINAYRIEKVTEHSSSGEEKDVTQQYRGIGDYYSFLPAIGHATVGHAPDVCNVSFSIRHQDKPAIVYSRDNRDTFLTAAEYIYDYLCSCNESSSNIAFSELRPKLLQGFYANSFDISEMTDIWSSIFPDIQFYYDKTTVLERLFLNGVPSQLSEDSPGEMIEASDKIYELGPEFYPFTLLANEVRTMVSSIP